VIRPLWAKKAAERRAAKKQAEAPKPPPPHRRSLSHVGGSVDTGGSRAEGLALARALEVQPAQAPSDEPSEGEDRAHVHGFHTYPARMHPLTASRLVEAFSKKGGTVLDPFCGSGTVLVEAMVAGRAVVGTDLNPIAVRLSLTKTRPRTPSDLAALVAAARLVAAFAKDRRLARAGATRRLPKEDVEAFDPHVLLELDSLRAGIDEKAPGLLKADLFMVLSAILVKLSRKRGDTSEQLGARRIAAGYPSKLFVRKAEELARRVADLEALLPKPRPTVRVALDDAIRLSTVADGSIDLALTSPPYAGTYDYLAHHALRLRWLGLDTSALQHGELGARRTYASLGPREAGEAWAGELKATLSSIERVLRPGGLLVLLIGDSAVGTLALRAHEIVEASARGTRMECVARASQERPHFHGPTSPVFRSSPRREHALLLRRR
jgi:SAM-dependent methyltransferase